MATDPAGAYTRCKERLAHAQESDLKYRIERYEGAGELRRFFWALVNDYSLESQVAEEILEERKKSHDQWMGSVGPGKIT